MKVDPCFFGGRKLFNFCFNFNYFWLFLLVIDNLWDRIFYPWEVMMKVGPCFFDGMKLVDRLKSREIRAMILSSSPGLSTSLRLVQPYWNAFQVLCCQ